MKHSWKPHEQPKIFIGGVLTPLFHAVGIPIRDYEPVPGRSFMYLTSTRMLSGSCEYSTSYIYRFKNNKRAPDKLLHPRNSIHKAGLLRHNLIPHPESLALQPSTSSWWLSLRYSPSHCKYHIVSNFRYFSFLSIYFHTETMWVKFGGKDSYFINYVNCVLF